MDRREIDNEREGLALNETDATGVTGNFNKLAYYLFNVGFLVYFGAHWGKTTAVIVFVFSFALAIPHCICICTCNTSAERLR